MTTVCPRTSCRMSDSGSSWVTSSSRYRLMLRKPSPGFGTRDLADLGRQPAGEALAAAANADQDEAALGFFRLDDLMGHACDRPLDLFRIHQRPAPRRWGPHRHYPLTSTKRRSVRSRSRRYPSSFSRSLATTSAGARDTKLSEASFFSPRSTSARKRVSSFE